MAEGDARDSNKSTTCPQCTQQYYRTHAEGRHVRNSPCFFKIITESMEGIYSIPSMQIPAAFAQQYLSEFDMEASQGNSQNRNVYLEGPSGQIWPVTMMGCKTSLGFRTGWKRFAMDYALVLGDLLVFKLISNNHFRVQVFGKDGCEKEGFFTECLSPNIEDESVKKRKDRADAGCCTTLNSLNEKKLKLEQSKAKVCNFGFSVVEPIVIDAEEDEIILLDGEKCSQGKQSALKCNKEQEATKALTPTAEIPLDYYAKEPLSRSPLQQIEDRPEFEKFQQGCGGKTQESSSLQEAKSLYSDLLDCQQHIVLQETGRVSEVEPKEYITKVHISRRRPVSQAERERTLRDAKSYKTSRPMVRKIMKESNVYRGFWLSFPLEFVRKYLPGQVQPVTLVDSSGQEWSAKLLGSHHSPGISAGWRKFALDHRLEEGDVCIFEVMDKNKIVIKVHIYRVVDLTCNLNGQHHHDGISKKTFSEDKNANNKISMPKRQRQSQYSVLKKRMRGVLSMRRTTGIQERRSAESNAEHSQSIFSKVKIGISQGKGFEERSITPGNCWEDFQKKKKKMTAIQVEETRPSHMDEQSHMDEWKHMVKFSSAKRNCSYAAFTRGPTQVEDDALHVSQTVGKLSKDNPEELDILMPASPNLTERISRIAALHKTVESKQRIMHCHSDLQELSDRGINRKLDTSQLETVVQLAVVNKVIKSSITEELEIPPVLPVEIECGLLDHQEKPNKLKTVSDTMAFVTIAPDRTEQKSFKPSIGKNLILDSQIAKENKQADIRLIDYSDAREGQENSVSLHVKSSEVQREVIPGLQQELPQHHLAMHTTPVPTTSAMCGHKKNQKQSRHKSLKETEELLTEQPLERASMIVKGQRTYYEVQRLISKRKGKGEAEFLVELTKGARSDDKAGIVEEEDGAWWVPFSHFKNEFTVCHL